MIVSTTLNELESGRGQAVTGGGTLLPMSDVIRLASHAYHHLVIFDRHTEIPLYLGRTRRTASAGQRIVLHACHWGAGFLRHMVLFEYGLAKVASSDLRPG